MARRVFISCIMYDYIWWHSVLFTRRYYTCNLWESFVHISAAKINLWTTKNVLKLLFFDNFDSFIYSTSSPSPQLPPPPLLCLISSFPFAMPCRVFYSLVICSFHLQLQFPVQIPRYLYTICVLFVDALRQTNAATLQLMSVCSVLEKVHAKTYNERFL